MLNIPFCREETGTDRVRCTVYGYAIKRDARRLFRRAGLVVCISNVQLNRSCGGWIAYKIPRSIPTKICPTSSASYCLISSRTGLPYILLQSTREHLAMSNSRTHHKRIFVFHQIKSGVESPTSAKPGPLFSFPPFSSPLICRTSQRSRPSSGWQVCPTTIRSPLEWW